MSKGRIIGSWIGEVYLTSCVRTSLGLYKGALKEVSDSRLGAIVIDSVLQRSAIDKSSVDHVLIESSEASVRDMLSFAGLPDTTKYSLVCGCNGLKSIAPAMELLTRGLNVTVCGGTSIWSEQDFSKWKNESTLNLTEDRRQIYANLSMKKLQEAKKNGLLMEGIEPVIITGHPRLKRSPVNLIEDESAENSIIEISTPLVDGAAACLLSTKDFLSQIKVSPLGKVVSLVETSSPELSACSILEANNLKASDIHVWQINDVSMDDYDRTVNTLRIDESLINVQGGTTVIGYNTAMSGIHNLVALVHSLKPHQNGIVVHGTPDSAIALLIEKLPVKSNFLTPNKKPVLYLYTKDPCPLCDELKIELAPYLDRVHLEEIYLTPESYFYKLYRYEIPVLFLGGRFVCRNKFNVQMFERILNDFEHYLK